jgi:hypothetical protein
MKRSAEIAAIAVLASACGPAPSAAPMHEITEEEAIASARQHLPWFLDRLAEGDPADKNFGLTVRMPAESGREAPELSMLNVGVEGAELFGTVGKGDVEWPEYAEGKVFRFGRDVVIDWSFTHADWLIGAFRLKAQMCKLGQFLTEVRGKTADAEAARTDLLDSLDAQKACEPYDPLRDYARAPHLP